MADEDIPAIVKLMNRAYGGSGGTADWSTEEPYFTGDRTTDTLLRADLGKTPSASLLKWQGSHAEEIIGCVWLEPIGEGAWYLGSLSIDPEKQNSGLGRTLLAAAEDWTRQRGARHMRMWVINVREALIAWYLRRGYVKTGTTEPFPYGDDRFGRPLRDDLCFVILEKSL